MTTINLQLKDNKISQQWEKIKVIRAAFKESPIANDAGVLFDHDIPSQLLFKEAIENYAYTTQMKDPETGKQMWKSLDNQIHLFSEQEFSELVAELGKNKAIFYDAKFAYAEYIRTLLPLPDDSPLFDGDNWP
jgi:hypothetical protein